MWGLRYQQKPHTFAIDVLYDRDRFNEQAAGRESDSFLIMPAWQGTIGPFTGFAEGLIGFGEVRTPTTDFDVFNWAVIAGGELNLGTISPFLGFIYASGDDDPNDTDLNGFNPVNHGDVQLISLGSFPDMDSPIYDLFSPCVGNSPLCGGAGAFTPLPTRSPMRLATPNMQGSPHHSPTRVLWS